MIGYFLISSCLIFLAILNYELLPFTIKPGGTSRTVYSNYLFYCLAFFFLLVIAGLRGDFTSDYNNYSDLFHYYNQFTFSEIWNRSFGEEVGFVVLNKVCGFFNENVILLMLASAAITLFLHFREFNRYSCYLWLSVLLFVNIGAYYVSFNIMRQILAVSIVFSASTYLYKREILPYLIWILVASLFHKTSLVMVLFFFLLNKRPDLKNVFLFIFLALTASFLLEPIISLAQKYVYKTYTTGAYGMTGYNWKNIVLPAGIFIFTIAHFKIFNKNNIRHVVWLNSTAFYLLFSLLGLKVFMIQRFAEFFQPYTLLIIPLIISKIENKNMRIIYFFGIISLSIAYSIITKRHIPYHFIWGY